MEEPWQQSALSLFPQYNAHTHTHISRDVAYLNTSKVTEGIVDLVEIKELAITLLISEMNQVCGM